MPTHYLNLTTRDGRQLDYLQAGPSDAPALLFHVGTPGAGSLFQAIAGPASELGLQVISYSRPGYGGSAEHPGRRVTDAVNDIIDLLDHLTVSDFYTAGWSGGGPHALACAALLPERCRAAAVVAGVAPYDAHGIDFLAGMAEDNVLEFTAAATGEAELSAYLTPLIGQLQQVTGASVADSLAGLVGSVDQAALTGEFAEELAQSFRTAMASGIAGWRDDDLAFVQDWGFRLSDIRVPVSIWQGRQDRMVPFAHGQWLAAEIPTAQPHLFAAEGHLSLIAQMDQILADLLSLAGSTGASAGSR